MTDGIEAAQKANHNRVSRGVYVNRTLNMRSIRAIGYDMDYTLVHYHVHEWEKRAFEHVKQRLLQQNWPVESLHFDPTMVIRGLVLDVEKGNLLKVNRFGFVKRAVHGTRTLALDELRSSYARTMVDLSEPRWIFLNTLFSISEGGLYAQLVDLLDQGKLHGPMGYPELYAHVKKHLDLTHIEGELKAEIVGAPERFVDLDPEAPLALLDQKHAGKKLLLITNSDWNYTHAMMTYAFDQFLPSGMKWKDLFDLTIVSARKPEFFAQSVPFLEVLPTDGLLRPGPTKLQTGGIYYNGSAAQLERYLGLSGDEILYIGDHLFGDVHMTKRVLRWRTALILRELEEEIMDIEKFRATEATLAHKMSQKELLEQDICQARLRLQRKRFGYGDTPTPESEFESQIQTLRSQLITLDAEIAPLAKAASEIGNRLWGPLMRSGNDKSHLARQVERYADVYTSRVSNFAAISPFVYLRSPRGSLPHDPSIPGGAPWVVQGVYDR